MFEMTFLKNQHKEYEALAQIAEMERIAGMEEMLKTGDETTKSALFPAYFTAKANEQKPLTWNERINQMTVEEKAREFFYQGNGDYFSYISINGEHCETPDEAIGAGIRWLNSPYTEGDADEG